MANHKHSAQAAVGAAIGEKTERATGSGILSYTLTATSRTKILSFRLGNATAPTTSANLVLSIQSPSLGTQYACTTLSSDMQDSTSLFYTESMYLEEGDVFKAEWANADGVQWGLSVVYADLGVN